MSVNLDIPSDLLEADTGPFEQCASEIQPSVESRGEKHCVGDVATLLASIARNIQGKQVEELMEILLQWTAIYPFPCTKWAM